MSRRRLMDSSSGKRYLDVVVVQNGSIKFVPGSQLTINSGTPVGIVVIPGEHDVYMNGGKAGVMSLVNMSSRTPQQGDKTSPCGTGSTFTIGNFPNQGRDTQIFNLAIYGNTTSKESEWNLIKNRMLTGQVYSYLTSKVLLPSDKWEDAERGWECPTDSTTWYYNYDTDSTRGYMASPYMEDGSKNIRYTSDSSGLGFDGKNPYLMGVNPSSLAAIQYCTSYRPDAITSEINSGMWYLPSVAELGYMAPRLKAIDDTIALINEIFGQVASPLHYSNQNLWSSTLAVTYSAGQFPAAFGALSLMNGGIVTQGSTKECSARAFVQITPKY